MITRKQLIEEYLRFFKEKEHAIIPPSPLIPEHDPTVLFTTAGMHPLVPFLLGQPHPEGKRLADVQICLRTDDMNEVGDAYHHTFFEMLGNWSLGDYWKKEAISWSFEFLTKRLRIPVEKLAISCFGGEGKVPKDEEAAKVWMSLGIPRERIAFLGKKENWWGPAGKTGPCGPDTEMFVWIGKEKAPKEFDPKDKKWVEIWNDVFMQYNMKENGELEELKQKNVDTGMGVERVLAILNNFDDNYLTEIFAPIIKRIEELSGKKYESNKKSMRIIADHLKAATFVLAEGIPPGNKEHSYVLRRLIRRAIRHAHLLEIEKNFTKEIAKIVIRLYERDYKQLREKKNFILDEIEREENKFKNTLKTGLKYFEKISKGKKEISGKEAFLLYQSYGFPIEMTLELAREKGLEVNTKEFEKEYEKHRELSRTATKGKFKAGLADTKERTIKLHTATHLLLAALRKVLGKKIVQKGSNITSERLRFDFNFDRKLTNEEIKKIEGIVNEKISEGLQVRREEMTLEEAKKLNALGTFEHKYGEKVSVYFIGERGKEFSIEICAGPHVENTRELGHFKIIKQESVGAGIRRIKATLEEK